MSTKFVSPHGHFVSESDRKAGLAVRPSRHDGVAMFFRERKELALDS